MRVRQHITDLRQLLAFTRAGRLVPAGFQRDYVWSQAQVIELMESIAQRLPIGSFLTWTPHDSVTRSAVSRNRLGPVVIPRDAGNTSLLLDGQNRLASVLWLYHDHDQTLPEGLSVSERDIWATDTRLVVDLLARDFRFVPVDESESGMRLPARAVVDRLYASPLVRRRWDNHWGDIPEAAREDSLHWFDRVQDAFGDTQVVAVDMEDATVEEARSAFLRICRAGVPMSQVDFDAAVSWSPAG